MSRRTTTWSELRSLKRARKRKLRKKAIEKAKPISETMVRARKYRSSLAKNPTLAEQKLRNELDKHDIYHQFQRIFYTKESFFIVDFWIPTRNRFKLIVEVDGKSHDKTKEKDFQRTFYLMNNHYVKLVRFKNEQVFNDLSGVVEAIRFYKPLTKQEWFIKRTMNMAFMKTP